MSSKLAPVRFQYIDQSLIPALILKWYEEEKKSDFPRFRDTQCRILRERTLDRDTVDRIEREAHLWLKERGMSAAHAAKLCAEE